MCAFALGVAKFPHSAVSISCHSDRKDVKNEIKTPVPTTLRSLTILWVPYKRLSDWCFWKLSLSAAHSFGFQEQLFPAHLSFSWGLSILVPKKLRWGHFDLPVPGCNKSRNVCSELKAGDAQHDPSPWQIRLHYFHAIPWAGLPHAAKCSTVEIQFTGREIKPVPQWKTDDTFCYHSTDEKGTLLGMLHVLYKTLRHVALPFTTMNASSQHAKIILRGKNPSI